MRLVAVVGSLVVTGVHCRQLSQHLLNMLPGKGCMLAYV
jgi:hypothetical protein